MKKLILVTFIFFNFINFSNASTLKDLNITDSDFLKILYSPKKNHILDRITDLILLKKSLKKVDNDLAKLTSVNEFFNEFKESTDKKIYNKKDYWATRKEFIFKGSGDCEDFVIAKYFTLIELGVEENKLSLLHGIYKDQYHLVLAYQDDPYSDPFILDNINKKILPLTQRNDLLVLYTLKTINLTQTSHLTSDLEALSNYKWTKIYIKEKEEKLIN